MARLALAGIPLIALAACATPPREFTDPRPTPTVEQRAAFGTIGIAASGVAKPMTPNAPVAASDGQKVGVVAGASGYGVAMGAAEGLACGPFAIVCVPAFAVVGGVIGLGVGTGTALSYPSEGEIYSAHTTLRNALLSVDVEDRLVETVLAQASGDYSDNLRRVGYSAEADTWDIRNADGEVDTRILIAVSQVALVGMSPSEANRPGANPPVRLEMVVEAQIFEGDREVPTFERGWFYDSEVHDYLDWADDQGILVVTELKRAINILGAKIVADFLAGSYQSKQRLAVDEKLQANLAAQDARSTGARQPSERSTASPAPSMTQSETYATEPRELRVAVFPFAHGAMPNDVAESQLANQVHRFLAQQHDVELIYSAYDDRFGHPAVDAASSFWTGGYASRTPNEMNVYRVADTLDADLVITYFHKKQSAGWYSGEQYRFELYVFDVRRRQMYRGSGDDHSVREVLEAIFWQLERKLTAS